MAITYLDNKNWSEITREERYFWDELYFSYKKQAKKLVEDIFNVRNSEYCKINCINETDLEKEWELGYEVCFYRDFIHDHKQRIKNFSFTDFHKKRTFDLCLFSEDKIIIIEAKVQQSFKKKQLDDFVKDRLEIMRLIKPIYKYSPEIHIIGLASKKYYGNIKKYKK